MRKLVINDANMLIDFCELNIVPQLFQLDYTLCTVDMVWDELRTDQQAVYLPYLEQQRFTIRHATDVEFAEVLSIRSQRKQLSYPDCTALVYAKYHQGILLSSDKNLRATARQHQVEVHGHLWIFDRMYESGVLTGTELRNVLDVLRNQVNPRLGLPEEEWALRMEKWIQDG